MTGILTEMKKFSIKDGAGILLARQAGIETVILTGRERKGEKRREQKCKNGTLFHLNTLLFT